MNQHFSSKSWSECLSVCLVPFRFQHKYHVTFDSANTNEFVVHKTNGTTQRFKDSNQGLYYHDTSEETGGVAGDGTALVTKVADNAHSYTNADYSQALLAHRTQKIIGHPSIHDYIWHVEHNLIPNCPLT